MRTKIFKPRPNLPTPVNQCNETFEQEQSRVLEEEEVRREILGLDNRARREYSE